MKLGKGVYYTQKNTIIPVTEQLHNYRYKCHIVAIIVLLKVLKTW